MGVWIYRIRVGSKATAANKVAEVKQFERCPIGMTGRKDVDMFDINSINTRNNEEFIALYNAGKINSHLFSDKKLDWGTTTHLDRTIEMLNNIGFGRIIVDSKKIDRGEYKYISAITTTGLKVVMTVDGLIITIIPQQRYQLLKDFEEFFRSHPKAAVLLERADKNQRYNTQYR